MAAGERSHSAILEAVRKKLGEATQAKIDYADLRDPRTLETAPAAISDTTLLAVALEFERDPDGRGAAVRLIDNRLLHPNHPSLQTPAAKASNEQK